MEDNQVDKAWAVLTIQITSLIEKVAALQREVDLLKDQIDMYWNPKI